MNKSVEEFYRTEIKNGLHKLKDEAQDIFKRMYAHTHPTLTIDEVVDKLQVEHLDWALTQVHNTLKKKEMLRDEEESRKV